MTTSAVLPTSVTHADRNCPGCETSTHGRRLGEQDGFPWVRCATCGCHFAARNPTAAELSVLYGTYYRQDNLQVPDFIQLRLAEIVRSFEPHRDKGRLLDVGFGAGGLLTAAEEAGWQCWGTEVSAPAIVAGRRRGWRVLEGDLCKIGLPSDLFDVICMVEVLEHLENPGDYVRQAFQLLRPGGLLYATTPNGSSLNSHCLGLDWSVYGAPEHLQLFTPGSLKRAMRRAGFSVRILTEGLNPCQLRAILRRRKSHSTATPDYGEAGRTLNETLSSKPMLRVVKRTANVLLTATGVGDSIKVFATKPHQV